MKKKIKLLKEKNMKRVRCRDCDGRTLQVWLETVGGLTGLYCKDCGRRFGSGVSVDSTIPRR